ncbi:sensor histidine kinase [Tessaracoccus sp. OH4464_COT-324]|uniref:sensor histidine kinase n=1 Tax=Tessaracoccus sp. OH4464_COT-324 TaxID=2491059 RepID=UPI000F641813|nr:histidine kinase [Tessaracoccus sp. OH4464_COT-324]RRD47086.1 sensor histidine kinase [Tessaracoccus sp. OH4464_COT-324]
MLGKYRPVDALLAIVASALFPLLLLLTGDSGASYSPLAVAFTLLIPLPLAARRTHPGLSMFAMFSLFALQALLYSRPLLVDVLALPSIYSAAAHGSRQVRFLAGLAGFVGCIGFTALLRPNDTRQLLGIMAVALPVVLLAWALGWAKASWLNAQRATQHRQQAEELARAQDAELAVAAERSRIAREMHDIVAHSLAVIIAQADGGRYAAQADPAKAAATLETISDLGRGALADIRRILGVLRSDDVSAPLVQPQPTGEDLAEIINRVRATGVEVAFTTMGAPRALLPGMGLTLQRVCQEALTNSLKHAGVGARMAVMLKWEPERVVLQVDDDGRGAAALSDGRGGGIVGMRERAQLFGGTLSAAPRPTGGYRVSLTLPLTADQPEE